ncbi:hypothetical protein P4H27_10065 [Paenibacillus taichungensis]|uniref:hypothetical protein n=1 Tax=Paenibacillus taichungensis TaxID=484184 RepID=UPI002DBEF0CE|nr:hypothetical protein [Paenibacillus taichungensis]MEC0107281.1 hypothetical protein [Paenibacillus taichungensis]MEC0194787.1 hypothetical protein [Paenibacillus taichungensis]
MNIRRKIYYDLETGNVIKDTGEHSGDFVETTREQDFSSYIVLSERLPETIGMKQLEYGSYASDFAGGGVITRVDLETLEPLFTYPDPTDPETPEEPRPALSKQIEALEQETLLLKAQSGALSERADFVEDVIAEMAVQVYE